MLFHDPTRSSVALQLGVFDRGHPGRSPESDQRRHFRSAAALTSSFVAISRIASNSYPWSDRASSSVRNALPGLRRVLARHDPSLSGKRNPTQGDRLPITDPDT